MLRGVVVQANGERWRAGRRLWSADDDARLRELYPDLLASVVAAVLRRSVTATHARARQLGLEKSESFRASIDACRLRRDSSVGVPHRFKKGQVPPNKGTRRPGWAAGRMRETQFKAGQAPLNSMPIGATRLDGDGYVLRKVADIPNVPYTVNWKWEHRLVWEAAHGPVPKGHRVIFRNGDRTDIRLDNLVLATPGDMMARNSLHNLPKELVSAYQLLGAINRQIRKREGAYGKEQN